MAKFDVVDRNGKKVSEIELSDAVFGITPNEKAVHIAVVNFLANQRQGTQNTKIRKEVSGGGKKPWRQKGTGRARAGDCKSPIWVGGGTVFGPDGMQNYKLSQNKKAHSLALRGVLSEKVGHGLIVVDSLALDKASTKDFATALKAIKAEGKTLVVVGEGNDNLVLSARNIGSVELAETWNISVYDVLNCDNLVVSKDDIKKIEEALK